MPCFRDFRDLNLFCKHILCLLPIGANCGSFRVSLKQSRRESIQWVSSASIVSTWFHQQRARPHLPKQRHVDERATRRSRAAKLFEDYQAVKSSELSSLAVEQLLYVAIRCYPQILSGGRCSYFVVFIFLVAIVHCRLGRGAYGTVYLCEDKNSGEQACAACQSVRSTDTP